MSSAAAARPPDEPAAKPELTAVQDQPQARTLGLTSTTGLVIGTVIGAGVFTRPGVLAGAGTISLVVLAVIARPVKFVGPVYQEQEARDLAAERGWQVRRDGTAWRRVVPSPEPLELVELPLIQLLLQAGALVVCAGGGGIPVTADKSGALRGVQAVVDKDLTAALLARAVNADALLLLLTDVDAVIDGFGTPGAHPIRHATPGQLRARSFPAGSMGPKVEAACRFVEATGRMAAIGRLDAAPELLRGTAGTTICP